MTFPALLRRTLGIAALAAVVTVPLMPATPARAQNSATAAGHPLDCGAGTLTPGGVSAVLNAAGDRNGQPSFLTADQAFQVAAAAAGRTASASTGRSPTAITCTAAAFT